MINKVTIKEKGFFQKAYENGVCPKCSCKVDYTKEPIVCSVCSLQISYGVKDDRTRET
tara:strand:- start:94 stop:267 length:174 start_codon:yes stop_codon:yes gene_type:complete